MQLEGLSITTFCTSQKSLILEFESCERHGTARETMQALHTQLQISRVYDEKFTDCINNRAVRIEKMNRDELQFQSFNFTGRRRGRPLHCHSYSDALLIVDRRQRAVLQWIRLHISKILDKVDEVGVDVKQTDFDIND